MGKHNEQLLSALEAMADSARGVQVPERIDDYIRNGMRRAQEERKASARIRKAWIGGAAAAAVLLLAFMTTVRVSPAFAAIVSEVPGLHYIAKLIGGDRGLVAAVNNDFIQRVGKSVTHDEVTVTLDGIIADETRMNLFYTIEFPKDYGYVELTDIRFKLPDGKALSAGYSWGHQRVEDAANGSLSNRIDVSFGSGVALPDTFTLEAKVERSGTELAPTWSFPISIDRERFESLKMTYPIGQTVTVEGQNIEFVSATVHPTQIAVDVEFDPSNTKKIFSFVDLKLIGDHGEVYRQAGSTHVSDDKQTIYFQGSSFSIPESLTISGSKLRALDRDRLELVVDTKEGVLLQAPDGNLQFERASREGKELALTFTLNGIGEEDKMLYSLSDAYFQDGSGSTFQVGGGGMWSRQEERSQTHTFNIPDAQYVQPLTFTLTHYPAYITGDFQVHIK